MVCSDRGGLAACSGATASSWQAFPTVGRYHWQYDTFRVDWDDASVEPAYMTFSLDADGRARRITMKAVSPLADFSYDYHDLLFEASGP
ncbi:DUF3471 domain-containing protein [Pseudoxanthomonas sp. LjRoot143]|uniref:DUF3471 domain-containing protein n=1 Tax=Pseudoxanthomonas sp. LjRoot143 TaxID=3342266 RepID=UPI003ECF5E6B